MPHIILLRVTERGIHMSKTQAEQRSCIYLNGEPVDSLPQWALDKMAENLSLVVSLYFREHPDEDERYLNSKEHQEYLMKRR